jgi:hypothetical protein
MNPNDAARPVVAELQKDAKDQIAFLKRRLRNPAVFQVRHENANCLLVELLPSKKIYFINLMGKNPKDSINYSSKLDEELEGSQPYCAIGSYAQAVSLEQAIALADRGHATFDALSVPINRAAEEIIKMDWGMRVLKRFV